MRLGKAKDLIWMLLDEYSTGGAVERDEDIALRIPAMLDARCKYLSTIKMITETYTVPLRAADKPQAYEMPANFYRPHQLWADNVPIACGTWRKDSLILPGDESREIIVEYYAYHPDITDETPDDTELQLDDEAAKCACYFAAADLLMVDLFYDNARLLAEANRMMERLQTEAYPQQVIVHLLD